MRTTHCPSVSFPPSVSKECCSTAKERADIQKPSTIYHTQTSPPRFGQVQGRLNQGGSVLTRSTIPPNRIMRHLTLEVADQLANGVINCVKRQVIRIYYWWYSVSSNIEPNSFRSMLVDILVISLQLWQWMWLIIRPTFWFKSEWTDVTKLAFLNFRMQRHTHA